MHMKKSNTNRPNTTINRGKIAAIAGLTLTCGMILSDVAPVMAATENNNIEVSKSDGSKNKVHSESSIYNNPMESTVTITDNTITISKGLINKEVLSNALRAKSADITKIKNITIANHCIADKNISGLFRGFTSLETITGLNNLNTSQTENLSNLFENDSNIRTIDLSKLDLSNANDISGIFKNSGLTSIDITKLNTANVKNMSSMFEGTKFTTIDLSKLNTGNVTDMSAMFKNSALTNIDVTKFNTNNVKNMSSMFEGSHLKALNVSNWNISKNTNIGNFVYDSNSLENILISKNMNFNDLGLSGTWFQLNNNVLDTTTEFLYPNPTKTPTSNNLLKRDGKQVLFDNLKTNIDDFFINGFIKENGTETDLISVLKNNDNNLILVTGKKPVTYINEDGCWIIKTVPKIKLALNGKQTLEKVKTSTPNVTAKVEINPEIDENGTVSFSIVNISDSSYQFDRTKKMNGKLHYDNSKKEFYLTTNDIKLNKASTSSSSSTSSTPDKTPSTNHKVTDKVTKIIHKLTTLFHHRHIKLYNRDFKESADRSLSAGSDWYSDQTIEHNGKTYYRVSKNEYVAAEDIYSYEDKDVVVSTKADSDKDLVDSQGKMSNRRLAKGTPWKSDRTIKINGKTYYRVSTDEFVSADDVIVR